MKTLDLVWMRPYSWAVIFHGEGAQAIVIEGSRVPDEIHAGMCCCGCGEAACRDGHVAEILEEMKDSENWRFAENCLAPFEFSHDFEIGGLQIVRITAIKFEGRQIL